MDFAFENLSLVEAVWLVSAVLGLAFGWVNLRQSKADAEEAERVKNGLRDARMIVASGFVFRNWVRVIIFGWWTLLGVGFGFFNLPDIPRIGGLLGLMATAVGWTLIGVQETAERRELTNVIAKNAVERAAALVAEEVREQLTRTADNTERIAENTEPKTPR